MAGDVVMGDAKATGSDAPADAGANKENLYPITEIADLKFKYERTKDKAVGLILTSVALYAISVFSTQNPSVAIANG